MKLTVIWNYFQSDTEERLQEEKRRKIEEHEKARARGRTKKKHNDIDPMDPAAYSDIPRYGFVRLTQISTSAKLKQKIISVFFSLSFINT